MIIHIVKAEPRKNYDLWLEFEDGRSGVVNIKEQLGDFNGVWRPFRNVADFERVYVDPESGTVTWPWGEDMDPWVLYCEITKTPILKEASIPYGDDNSMVRDYFKGWAKTHECENAIEALRFIIEQIDQVHDNPSNWKWVVVGMHNALMAWLISSLQSVDGVKLVSASVKNGMFTKINEPLKSDWTFILDMNKRIQYEALMSLYSDSKAYVPSSEKIEESLNTLNDLRNNFIQFSPGGWYLNLAGIPGMLLDCLEPIEFLIKDSNTILWPKDEMLETAIQLVDELKVKLQNVIKENATITDSTRKAI